MDWSHLQEDYERLGSFKAIAAEYGTYPETVSRAAKRLGIRTRHSLNIDWSGLRELYDSGMTQAELADPLRVQHDPGQHGHGEPRDQGPRRHEPRIDMDRGTPGVAPRGNRARRLQGEPQ